MPATPTTSAGPGAHVGGQAGVRGARRRTRPRRATAPRVGGSSAKKRSVTRTAPMSRLRTKRGGRAGSADGELGAAAADVDDGDLGGVRLERRRGAAKGEARLLLPVDDAVRQVEVALDARRERRRRRRRRAGRSWRRAGGAPGDRRRRGGRRSASRRRVRAAASPSSRPVRSTPCPSRTTCVSRRSCAHDRRRPPPRREAGGRCWCPGRGRRASWADRSVQRARVRRAPQDAADEHAAQRRSSHQSSPASARTASPRR